MSKIARIFLLSPANLAGKRGRQFDRRLERLPGRKVAIGEAFAFVSGLYFRGKLAYARRFATAGAYVITSSHGLVRLDWPLDGKRLAALRRTPIDPRVPAYADPLARDARRIARAHPRAQFILLGSLATEKYLGVLRPILGDRLHCPAIFPGMGDMQRGSRLLKAAASGEELAYVPLPGATPARSKRREPRRAPQSSSSG